MPISPLTSLNANFLRDNYFPGLILEDADGRPLPATLMENRIRATLAAFQRRFAVRFGERVVKLGSVAVDGEPACDERRAGIDYHPDGGRDNRSHDLHLPYGPVKIIHALALWVPGAGELRPFPADWVHPNPPDPKSLRLRVYPGRSLNLPALQLTSFGVQMLAGDRPIPGAWHLTYTAGYSDDDLQGEDYDVLDNLAKLAACEVLVPGSADRIMQAGVTNKSVSVDGLGQSVSFVQNGQTLKFQALINGYASSSGEWMKTFWARQRGVKVISV